MPQYKLNDIPVDLWARFKERAQRQGWPLRALFLQLMDDYAKGTIEPSAPPPAQMPEYAWLRPYFRALASVSPQVLTSSERSAFARWEMLVTFLRATFPAGVLRLESVEPSERGRILFWLEETSQQSEPGPNKLSMRAISWIGEGPSLAENRRAIQFEVLGLPPGHQAWIADFQGEGWKILQVQNGRQGKWENPPFTTADDALTAIETALYFRKDDRGDTEHA